MTTPSVRPMADFFPKKEMRKKQEKLVSFIEEAIRRGYKDIIIAAPTGIGKSAIGICVCGWAGQEMTSLDGSRGGYYLVTQKLLQDQLESDFTGNPVKVESLKSAVEYPCPHKKNCAIGASSKKGCVCRKEGICPYAQQRQLFMDSNYSVTNYPYFLTEKTYVKKFVKRKIVIFDECHTLERQVIRFVDLTVGEDTLERWAPTIEKIPRLREMNDFIEWTEKTYMPEAEARLTALSQLIEDDVTDKVAKEYFDLDQHVGKIRKATKLIRDDPSDWVYWQEMDKQDRLVSIVRPLNAAPYMDMLFSAGDVRVYMSAYPGNKEIFCRSIGLDADNVAWASVGSTFPIENRPIVLGLVGSMSLRNVDKTLPGVLKVTQTILEKHHNEKGIIHCNSYKLGQAIVNHFKNEACGSRLIFPENADKREEAFNLHRDSPEPTVIVSPSMTEGFDFNEDLARWQIIAKMPYPSLSDKQVLAKKDLDGDWYVSETVKTLVQACGRICRSDTDRGITYVLDSDFLLIWEKYEHLFPTWFSKAFKWVNRR